MQYRAWAEFDISPLSGKEIANIGLRAYNDWQGEYIKSLYYTYIRPSKTPSALTSQIGHKYDGFYWHIRNNDKWTPDETGFFRPGWNAWPRPNGNTLIQDIQEHIDSGKTWFGMGFGCFDCANTARANLRFSSTDLNPETIIMEVETFDPLVKEKNFGLCVSCATCPSAGNPVNFATGNKYEMQRDFSLHGPGLPMGYVRYYNSQSNNDGYMGYGWAGTFSESVSLDGDKSFSRNQMAQKRILMIQAIT